MYEIALSHTEQIEQVINEYLHKWLGVPPCFLKIGLYTNTGNVWFPISSLVEEFKISNVRLHMMMRGSADECIRRVHPEIKSGTKRSAAEATQEVESNLRVENIMGVVQNN